MSNVFQPISNWQGPLPIDGDVFTPQGKTFFLFASGSGWAREQGLIGMDVYVNDVYAGTCQVVTNEVNSHKAFIPICVALSGLQTGQPATVRLQPIEGGITTITDVNDSFNVTVVEMD